MTDMSQQDISDETRGFTVDEIIERNAAPEHTPPMFGNNIESIETLIRMKHQRSAEMIDALVDQRAEINEQIKGLRRDHAILESAVNRYDRFATEDSEQQETLDFIDGIGEVEVLQSDDELTPLDTGI